VNLTSPLHNSPAWGQQLHERTSPGGESWWWGLTPFQSEEEKVNHAARNASHRHSAREQLQASRNNSQPNQFNQTRTSTLEKKLGWCIWILGSWWNDLIDQHTASINQIGEKQNQPVNLTGAWRTKENINGGAEAGEGRVPPAANAGILSALASFCTR
jgi:hypothetical protein